MGELFVAHKPVLAEVRGHRDNEANDQRVEWVLPDWSMGGQDIPHLRPAQSKRT